MKIILKSKNLQQKKKEDDEEVHLINQFFIPKDETRYNEIKFCLKSNVNNKKIDKIHLLVEQPYSSKELGVKSDKIIQINIKKRLSYNDFFSYIRINNLNGYIILANSDIYIPPESVSNVKKSNLKESKNFCALLRHEYKKNASHIFGPRYDSQDTWIIHSNNTIPVFSEHLFSFYLGTPGCDNKIIYLMSILGYEIINDPISIKTYHMHSNNRRSYTIKDIISEPWGLIIPYGFDVSKMIDSLGVNMRQFSIWTRNFTTLMYNDNDYLYNYINNKIELNKNFVIPRISGIENNIAVFTEAINKKLLTNIDPLRKYVKDILGPMKNNAGIKLENKKSINYYSQSYLQPFSSCDIFGAWDPQGNYISHIAQSHAYMQNAYSNKTMIWALSFDIFHYIFLRPWTQSLKGKRLLIISPFIDTIKEQIPIRTKIYKDIDLFPECEFVFLKPPQTQADEESKDFYYEFDNFKKKVDEMLNSFDIALVSCGGYGNPICGHIYMKGKSAIYIGGVLQMYFGILGNRWLKERPEIVKLYRNKYWKRPKEHERPKNSNKVENGCYW